VVGLAAMHLQLQQQLELAGNGMLSVQKCITLVQWLITSSHSSAWMHSIGLATLHAHVHVQ
jgi:hypothetical protein